MLLFTAIFFITYPSLDSARQACSEWSHLGLGIQQVESTFLDDSKILDFSKVVLEGEKRVCNLKLLERKVLGSIITDKNGTSSEVLFMEFRY